MIIKSVNDPFSHTQIFDLKIEILSLHNLLEICLAPLPVAFPGARVVQAAQNVQAPDFAAPVLRLPEIAIQKLCHFPEGQIILVALCSAVDDLMEEAVSQLIV